MIVVGSVIKLVRNSRGIKTDWPRYVRAFLDRLDEIKLGFPGLGNDHLTIAKYGTIREGDYFIFDECICDLTRSNDNAPILYRAVKDKKAVIEGIGCGLDSTRDPDRIKLRWKDVVNLPSASPEFPVLRVDVRPTLNGGPAYYYFYKAYRDNRY